MEGDTPNCAAISRMVIGRHPPFIQHYYIVGNRDSQSNVKSLVNKIKRKTCGLFDDKQEKEKVKTKKKH